MKIHTLFSTIALITAVSLITTPVHAQTDPCTVYMCMAGISGFGATGGPGCVPALAFWDAPTPTGLAVYDWWGFDPVASYAVRQSYLSSPSCLGTAFPTNAAILGTIMATWGYSLVP
jgi:hypothetical protein